MPEDMRYDAIYVLFCSIFFLFGEKVSKAIVHDFFYCDIIV